MSDVAGPDDIASAALLPPVPHPARPPDTDGSVLQLGKSPWLRMRSSTKPVVAPSAQVPAVPRVSGDALRDPQVALLGKMVKTIEQKELESGARKDRRVEEEAKELDETERGEENLRRCRWYFIVGCFGLPLVHIVSVIYFGRELKGREGDFKIKRYIYLSLIVAIVETFIVILWIVIFQLLRDNGLRHINILNANFTSFSLV